LALVALTEGALAYKTFKTASAEWHVLEAHAVTAPLAHTVDPPLGARSKDGAATFGVFRSNRKFMSLMACRRAAQSAALSSL
jgi:hypothetical protein